MQPFTRHVGLVVPIDRVNIDTDQIIPKQFLKRVERTGFGEFLFNDWRYLDNGTLNPQFVLNDERYRHASILLAGKNFGCGSSREHAVWALEDYGVRVVIAPSFADIFYNNFLGNGLLPIALPERDVDRLMSAAGKNPDYRLTVDLEATMLWDDHGFSSAFEIDPFHRHRLLNGLDDIGLTLQHEAEISAFELTRRSVAIAG